MNPELLEQIKNCKTLPAIPALPLQVLQMCRSEDVDIKKMAELISRDPTFVAKVLNVANSGFYGGTRHKVTTVTQAITLLGLNSIATLAFCFSLYRDLKRHGGRGFNHAQFWRRSLLASVAARVLGTWCKVVDREELFLAALLQDIGMLLLSETHSEPYGHILTQSCQDHSKLLELEQEQMGADHAEVGAWLAENWQLPEVLQAAIRFSHDALGEAVPKEYASVVKCVVLSGQLADIWCAPDIVQATQATVLPANALLGMELKDLEDSISQIASGFLEMASFFQIELGNADEIQEILDVAKEALTSTAVLEHAQSSSAT